jgi:transposase InsO family protein
LKAKRKPSGSVASRNRELLELIGSIKADHPFWGYRRIWATVRHVHGHSVNLKRVYRLMRLAGLTVRKDEKHKAIRTPRPKPSPDRPNQIWGIDMTTITTDKGHAYMVIVMDWYTKRITGHYVGQRCLASDWLSALETGLNHSFPSGVRGHGLMLVSDNGCQPTSRMFMRSCGECGITQVFTSYGNPKGNADTERMIRTIKEELVWINHWESPESLASAFSSWVWRYNEHYLHSSLGYMSPDKFERRCMHGQDAVMERNEGMTGGLFEEGGSLVCKMFEYRECLDGVLSCKANASGEGSGGVFGEGCASTGTPLTMG